MFKTMKLTPILVGLVIAIGLVGCEGNSSTTILGGSPVITPINIDKSILALDWDQNNEVEMASHAYRAIVRNSMLATIYSGQSAVFKSYISLVQGSRDIQCNVSGSIDASLAKSVCTDENSVEVSCTLEEDEKTIPNPAVKITNTEQSAIFYQCQDGVSSGKYLDGPLKVEVIDDFSIANVYSNTSRISAVAQVNQQDEKGNFVFNNDDEVIKVEATDFLLQNEVNTFLISYDYDLKTQYDTSSDRLTTRGISECTTEDKFETVTDSDELVFKPGTSIVTEEAITTALVAALQGPSPQLPYTEYSNLNLMAIKSNFRCEDLDNNAGNGAESLRFDTHYSLTTKVESKALGKNTQFNWTNLVIPNDQERIEGIITLTHTNQDSSEYIVTVAFDGEGNLTVNAGPQMTVQEFLDRSKVVAEFE